MTVLDTLFVLAVAAIVISLPFGAIYWLVEIEQGEIERQRYGFIAAKVRHRIQKEADQRAAKGDEP